MTDQTQTGAPPAAVPPQHQQHSLFNILLPAIIAGAATALERSGGFDTNEAQALIGGLEALLNRLFR